MSKETEYNRLMEKVIAKTPFGNWYPLMKAASNMLTKNLPKQVGIRKDTGEPIIVYRGIWGKTLGSFATPTHEFISKDLAQPTKKGLKGLFKKAANVLVSAGGGQFKDIMTQQNAEVFDLSPEEVKYFYENKELLHPITKDILENPPKTGLVKNNAAAGFSAQGGKYVKSKAKPKKFIWFLSPISFNDLKNAFRK